MADAMTKLTRDKFIPFIDTAKDKTFVASTWKRIDYSTIFELSAGEQTEDRDYICYPNAVTDVTSNKPELPQEIALYEGNPVYDFMIKELYNLPIGSDCSVPVLLCFGGADKRAWRALATVTSKTLNTADGKITFTLSFGGEIEKGTYTITEGVPSFTAASVNSNSNLGGNGN